MLASGAPATACLARLAALAAYHAPFVLGLVLVLVLVLVATVTVTVAAVTVVHAHLYKYITFLLY